MAESRRESELPDSLRSFAQLQPLLFLSRLLLRHASFPCFLLWHFLFAPDPGVQHLCTQPSSALGTTATRKGSTSLGIQGEAGRLRREKWASQRHGEEMEEGKKHGRASNICWLSELCCHWEWTLWGILKPTWGTGCSLENTLGYSPKEPWVSWMNVQEKNHYHSRSLLWTCQRCFPLHWFCMNVFRLWHLP